MLDTEKSLRALQQLTTERRDRPGVRLVDLVDDVARRFDLDAAQSEWLLRMALAPAPGREPSTCPTCGGALADAEGVAGHLACPQGHLVSRRGG